MKENNGIRVFRGHLVDSRNNNYLTRMQEARRDMFDEGFLVRSPLAGCPPAFAGFSLTYAPHNGSYTGLASCAMALSLISMGEIH